MFLCALTWASGAAAQSIDIDIEIAKRIVAIQTAPDAGLRIERAAHLAEYIASRQPLDVSSVEPPIIDGVAGLLDDNDDLVRFYAAASLGFFGSSARRAIPALEKALARREREHGMVAGQPRLVTVSLSSAQAICAAFAKIDLSRIPAACQIYR